MRRSRLATAAIAVALATAACSSDTNEPPDSPESLAERLSDLTGQDIPSEQAVMFAEATCGIDGLGGLDEDDTAVTAQSFQVSEDVAREINQLLLDYGCSGGGGAAVEADAVPLEPGDTMPIYSGGEREGTVTLHAIETEIACDYQYEWDATDELNGREHHVALEMTIEAEPAIGFINVPSFEIREQLDDGYVATTTAESSEANSCLQDKPLLDTVGEGEKQRGWVLYAVENPEGALVWRDGPPGDPGRTISYDIAEGSQTAIHRETGAPAGG